MLCCLSFSRRQSLSSEGWEPPRGSGRASAAPAARSRHTAAPAPAPDTRKTCCTPPSRLIPAPNSEGDCWPPFAHIYGNSFERSQQQSRFRRTSNVRGHYGQQGFVPRKGDNENTGSPLIFFGRVCLWGKPPRDDFTDTASSIFQRLCLKKLYIYQ